jgi:hypothetical protein
MLLSSRVSPGGQTSLKIVERKKGGGRLLRATKWGLVPRLERSLGDAIVLHKGA